MLVPEEYNTLIVGGGIVGSGIFRDLCLHKVPTLIIDRHDFASKTSQSSSKMLHGGIRYLENMDFELVYEALHEKNLWLKIAPHLCFEERFYLPVFKDSKKPLWMIKIGLFLYDLLSGFNNSPYEALNKSETLKEINILNAKNLSGAGIYSDAIVDDAKMSLEMIYDGLNFAHSKAQNYHEFLSEELIAGFHLVKIKNTLTNEIRTVKVKNIVYATGPFTDQIMGQQNPCWKNILLPSKGSHLWFKRTDIPLKHPLVMTTNDNRVIFVIPQHDLVLVGTTEIKTNEDFDHVTISDQEKDYLIQMLNNYFPDIAITKDKIMGSFSGIRPLVREDESNDLGKTSREHKIIQPTSSTYIIAGGKYTTFRVMGQEITRNIVLKLGRTYHADYSTQKLKTVSTIPPFSNKLPTDQELENILKNEFPKTLEDLVVRRLGVNSKEIWNYRYPVSFDDFFNEKQTLILKHINCPTKMGKIDFN